MVWAQGLRNLHVQQLHGSQRVRGEPVCARNKFQLADNLVLHVRTPSSTCRKNPIFCILKQLPIPNKAGKKERTNLSNQLDRLVQSVHDTAAVHCCFYPPTAEKELCTDVKQYHRPEGLLYVYRGDVVTHQENRKTSDRFQAIIYFVSYSVYSSSSSMQYIHIYMCVRIYIDRGMYHMYTKVSHSFWLLMVLCTLLTNPAGCRAHI